MPRQCFGRTGASGGLSTNLKVLRNGVVVKTFSWAAWPDRVAQISAYYRPVNVNSCQCKLFLCDVAKILLEKMADSGDTEGS
jgi:hypothetical protein